MDVRCEKCQTEYELDEARLKPGGVTVKCTNCGHMFRIRKRTITNVGTPPIVRDTDVTRARPSSMKPPAAPPPVAPPRPESILDDDARQLSADEAPTTVERQWLIRLDNGEQKSCRELATLQQWIITGVVTRESLISRTGKTWKRLGDVTELGQYFTIADEARANRDRMKPPSRPAPVREGRPAPAVPDGAGTLPGFGAAQAAGGTILPDDDDSDERTTPSHEPRGPARVGVPTPPPVPVRGAARTPPVGSPAALAPTELAAPPPTPPAPPTVPVRRAATTPPPPPPRRLGAAATPAVPPAIPQGNRATASWATDGVKPEGPSASSTQPFVGKLSGIPDEPAFAGRVRIEPGDEASFETGKVRALDDDDGVLPARRGSRAGTLVLVVALLVMAAAAAVIYVVVIRDPGLPVASAPDDAAVVATAPADAPAALDAAPAIDAAVVAEAPAPLAAERGELAADIEARLRTAAQSLDGKPDAPSQALRAHLLARLAQDLQDRASLTPERAAGDALRQEAKQIALDAASSAQRALRAAGDDAGGHIAMAHVLRLQGKPARDIRRYLDTARGKADPAWARELALADAMLLARDGKLDDARAAFAAIDQGDGKLESSGDVRARFHLALLLAAQNRAAEARPLVDAIAAAQPEHAGARALVARLETLVSKTDPLPPEDGTPARPPADRSPGSTGTPPRDGDARPPRPATPDPGPPAGGDSYDRLLQRANKLAETSCGQAMELYARALDQKPNGVEALTGMGYCHIDAKQFASAFSKFRAALAVSSRYEGALRGVAEAYQQQGRKEQAIEAYRAYLEVYPDSVAAKRQLERLGGTTQAPAPAPSPPAPSPSAPPAGGEPAAPTPTPPSPPPAPAPSPDPAGGGSGSAGPG